jgi:hypothetical protein
MERLTARRAVLAARDRWVLFEMAICGYSSAKVPKCAVGSVPVRVFAANFLVFARS